MLWVPSYDLCTLVPGAMCLQTADGSTLQVTNLSVTEGDTDCIDLPKTHGDYVRVRDDMVPESLEPDLTAQMRTGSCAWRPRGTSSRATSSPASGDISAPASAASPTSSIRSSS